MVYRAEIQSLHGPLSRKVGRLLLVSQRARMWVLPKVATTRARTCLLYTSDAADE